MKDNNKLQKINYNKLSQFQLVKKIKEQDKEIKKLKKMKKFGLVWDEEKTKEIFEQEIQDKLPVLKEVTKKRIDDDESKPTNILIEGDNYHALSVLNYTHKGKIDMIYIDPPYNRGTGNPFYYNDRLIDSDDPYKHSKWLSFMKKRLNLAKKLLRKDGVIFISIDDHELFELKSLCDEIFNLQNFVANFIWHKKAGGGSDNQNVVTEHEYVLCYSNVNQSKVLKNLSLNYDEFESYEGPDKHGRYYIREGILLRGPNSTKESRPNLCYPIKCPDGTEIWPREGNGTWRYAKKRLDNEIKKNNIIFKKNKKDQWSVFYKIYLYSETGEEKTKKSRSILNHRFRIGQTGEGTVTLKNILSNQKIIAQNITPKPISLIKHLIKLSRKNSIILDFFAGSGTTGHAVLDLIDEDLEKRQFILCTNNENNICSDVCYPRLKKVIRGYRNLKGEKVKGLGGNLKYFKTAFVDSKPNNKNKRIIISQSTEMLCLKEDCFNQVTLGKLFKIFKNPDGRYLGIVYDQGGIKPFKKAVLKLNKKINVYVFSLIDTVNDDTFEEISSLVTLKPIPHAIVNTYKKIFTCVETTKLLKKKYPDGLKQIRCESGVSEV